MTTTCPVCARSFRDAHGRGGHLATYNDEAHDAFRLQHGIKHPRGPDGKPTVVGARWRGLELPAPAAPPEVPPLAEPESATAPVLPEPVAIEPEPAAPSVAPTAEPAPLPAPATAAPMAGPAPSAPKESTAPSSSPQESIWIPLGIGVGSLAALILANKGKNAPKPTPAPTLPPKADPFPGIWAQPDPIQSTGFPFVDKMLGYSGLPATRRRLWP